MAKCADYPKESDLSDSFSQPHLKIADNLCEPKYQHDGEPVGQKDSYEKELYLMLRGQVKFFRDPEWVSAVLEMASA